MVKDFLHSLSLVVFMDFEKDAHNNRKNTKNSEVNVYLIVEMDITQDPKVLVE